MAFCGDTAEAESMIVKLIIRPVPIDYNEKTLRNTLVELGVPNNDLCRVVKYVEWEYGIAKVLDRQVAKKVMHILENKRIEGSKIQVKYSKACEAVEQVLYVTNFPRYCCTDDKLRTLLEQNYVRHIAIVRIINKPREKIYAYVAFNLQWYARQALDKIDGVIMGGTKLKALTCSKHLEDPAVPKVTIAGGSTDLHIIHFPKEYNTVDTLKALLEQLSARNVVGVHIFKDREFRFNRALASFETVEDAEAALNILNGFIGKSDLKVSYASFTISDLQKSLATTHDAAKDLFISNMSTDFDDNVKDEFMGKLLMLGATNLEYVRVFRTNRKCGLGRSACAFAYFQTVEDATAALGLLQGALVDGQTIKVRFSTEKADERNLLPASAPTTCPYLYVTNVPAAYGTDDKLKLLLDRKEVLNIVSVRVFIDIEKKVFAYVTFKTEEDARQASYIVDGLIVDVNKTLEAWLIFKTKYLGYPGVEKDLYVTNFHEAYCIAGELKKLLELSRVRNIVSVRVSHLPYTEVYACVTFNNAEDAIQALRILATVDRTVIGDKQLKAKLMSEYLKDLAMGKWTRVSARTPEPEDWDEECRTPDPEDWDEECRTPRLQQQQWSTPGTPPSSAGIPMQWSPAVPPRMGRGRAKQWSPAVPPRMGRGRAKPMAPPAFAYAPAPPPGFPEDDE